MSLLTLRLLNDTNQLGDGVTYDARLIGTAQADSIVTLLDGDTVLAEIQADQAGNFIYAPNLSDGFHALSVRQQVGDTLEVVQLVLQIDTAAPELTFFRMNDGSNADLPSDPETGLTLINAQVLQGDVFINAYSQGVETNIVSPLKGVISFTTSAFDIDQTVFNAIPVVRAFPNNPVGDGNMTSVIRAGSTLNTLFRQYVPDGSYTIHVNVSDLSGNSAKELKRSVIVDLRADAGEFATLQFNSVESHTVTKLSSYAVAFAVSGLDSDASAVARFTDGIRTQSVTISANGDFTVDLSAFTGVVSSNLEITDVHKNTTNVAGSLVRALVSTDGAHDDILVGEEDGNEILSGGIGNDSYFVQNKSSVLIENTDEGYDAVYSDAFDFQIGDNFEALVLYGNAVQAIGNKGDNTLIGNNGHNILNGMAGADTMRGGLGNDTYIIDDLGDVVDESDDLVGIDSLSSSSSFTLGAHVENLTLIGQEAIGGKGNDLANKITGNARANILHGMSGNDVLTGNGGADTLYGDEGADTLSGGADADLLHGGTGSDTIDGGDGFDIAGFSGSVLSYQVVSDGLTTIVSGPDGTDCLINVETLQFTDRPQQAVRNNVLDYTASYVDLAAAFGLDEKAAFAHYSVNGLEEGRKVSFDGLEYIASYDDLIAGYGANEDAGATHYIQAGRAEHRTTTFNGLEYIASYDDLITGYGANEDAGATHYIQAGAAEHRTTTFNGLEYIASYDDLIAGYGANEDAGAIHYIQAGRAEHRTTTFNGLEYIASYDDLIAGYGANEDAGAIHYIQAGAAEGRHVTFDAQRYLDDNPDLKAKYGLDLHAATIDYIQQGHNHGLLWG